MPEKPDAEQIRRFLAELQAESWLGKQRRDWPRYAYHYTDVRNAAKVLREGRLLSRSRSQAEGLLKVDAASTDVVGQSPWTHDYVRLYFRPRTSVQWHHEGHKTPQFRDNRYPDAHCPVPIFFLFDLEELLTEEVCRFSNGNLARRDHSIGDSAEFLRSLSFKEIYRDKRLPQDRERKRQLLFSMHAEVLFEDELALEHLEHVVCRSGSERDTLLQFLGTDSDRWRSVVRLEEAAERLYFREWGYIKSVQLVNGRVVIKSDDQKGQTFDVVVRVYDPEVEREYRSTSRRQLGPDFAVDLPRSPDRAAVRIDLHGELAFRAALSSRELF